MLSGMGVISPWISKRPTDRGIECVFISINLQHNIIILDLLRLLLLHMNFCYVPDNVMNL